MGLPQRDGRPALDLSPDATPSLASNAACQEDYGDVGMNPLNHPVPLRKGGPDENGWGWESVFATHTIPDVDGKKK